MKFEDIEKGDNLFELIFDLDRRLQIAQNHSSPISKLQSTLELLDGLLSAVIGKQPEIIDTVFAKLVDFFVKCGCNYKRQIISEYISYEESWVKSIKCGEEAVSKMSAFWDTSITSDFEACSQILKFMARFATVFFDQPASYGLLFEAFSELDSVKGSVFGNEAIQAGDKFLDLLFFKLNEVLDDEAALDSLIPTAKFAAFTVLKSFQNKEQNYPGAERMLLISSLIFPNAEITDKIINSLSEEQKHFYHVNYIKFLN